MSAPTLTNEALSAARLVLARTGITAAEVIPAIRATVNKAGNYRTYNTHFIRLEKRGHPRLDKPTQAKLTEMAEQVKRDAKDKPSRTRRGAVANFISTARRATGACCVGAPQRRIPPRRTRIGPRGGFVLFSAFIRTRYASTYFAGPMLFARQISPVRRLQLPRHARHHYARFEQQPRFQPERALVMQ